MSFAELAGLLQVRPITERLPAPTYTGQFSSPFSAKWTDTVELLARELRQLNGTGAILEVDLKPADFRVTDGLPRADRRAATPGVVLTVEGTEHGALRYPAFVFHRWQDNVRAIALALEALRKIDRYQVGERRGQQYTGWAALPAGGDSTPAGDVARGRELVEFYGSLSIALKRTHPDTRSAASDVAWDAPPRTDADYAAVLAYKASIQ